MTEEALTAPSVIALDLHDLLVEWASRRGFGLDGIDVAVSLGMREVRNGSTIGDAFERAKNAFMRL